MFYADDDLKIKDLEVDGKGIFYYINDLKPFTFNEIVDVETLDLGFKMLHGEKVLSPFVKRLIDEENNIKNDDMISLAKIILNMFGEKWEKVINIWENEINIDTYKLTTIEDITDEGTNTNTRRDINESERTGEVSAFNTEGFSNDEKETTKTNLEVTNQGNVNNNRKRHTETKGNINNRLDDINKALSLLQENVINDIIYIDVSQLIGLAIY